MPSIQIFMAIFSMGLVTGVTIFIFCLWLKERKEDKEYRLTRKIQCEAEVIVAKELLRHNDRYHCEKATP